MSLVITGSPGVGKHTVARRLAGLHGMRILDLNEVAARWKLGRMSEEGPQDVDVGRLGEIIEGEEMRHLLIVGHLAPYVLTRDQIMMAVVLRRNPYSLDRIYKERGYPERKRVENQGSEILGITAYDAITEFGADKTVQLDTTDRTAEQTAGAVTDVLLSCRRPADAVDWLSLVESGGDMERFFPDA